MNSGDKIVILSAGTILGIVITLVFVMIAYTTRSSIFYYCPKRVRKCGRKDYAQSLPEALDLGFSESEVLSVENGNLYFNKPALSCDCIDEKPKKRIDYPEMCKQISTGNNYRLTKVFDSGRAEYISKQLDTVILGKGCLAPGGDFTPLIRY